MKSISSKIYLEWGNKVIAVEVYNETPEEFTERTGIAFDQPTIKHGCKSYRPAVSEFIDYGLGEVTEHKKGFSTVEIPLHKNFAEIISTRGVFIAESDIERLSNDSGIMVKPQSGDDIGVEKNMQDYQLGFKSAYTHADFLGYIEIPTPENHAVLANFNQLSFIGAQGHDAKAYVPVFVFDGRVNDSHEEDYEGFYFDGDVGGYDADVRKINEEKPWIVMFYGTDNSSYGQRFETEIEARKFASLGFKAGFQDLLFYNS